MAASWGSTARCISPMIPPTTRSFTSPRGTWVSARSTRRSEEHTSELQSPCNLVCRLLLEKKNRPIVFRYTRASLAPRRSAIELDRASSPVAGNFVDLPRAPHPNAVAVAPVLRALRVIAWREINHQVCNQYHIVSSGLLHMHSSSVGFVINVAPLILYAVLSVHTCLVAMARTIHSYVFFFLNDPAPPEIYPLPLPAPLPI